MYFTLFFRKLCTLQTWKLSIYFSISIQYLFCLNNGESNTAKIYETSFLVFLDSNENFVSTSNAKYHIIFHELIIQLIFL